MPAPELARTEELEQHESDALLARYRAMAEEASDIIVLHEEGRIVCATGALWRLLKRTPVEFENGGYLALVHPDDLPTARTLLGTPPPGEIRRATYRVQHADGHYVWFEVATRGVYDEATGEFLREISVGREIGERKAHELALKAAQERAETANRAKSAFLANMSHELRTPLNAVLGFADLLRSEAFGPLGNPRYGEYAASIGEAGALLLSMVGNILDVAKLESGRFELERTRVDVGALAADCVGMHKMAAERGGVSLDWQGEPAFARVDAEAVKKILLNLLSNALKFTPAGGAVHAEVQQEGSDTVLRVRDSGCGMSQEQIARVSQPFAELCSQAALARRSAGAGLGLPLARALAEEHGGSLEIESAAAKGTMVTVRLPA
ncbi:MAG TPA: PAS domain-containing sensor histidine kinase [Rhizomicrobium sp.]